MTPLRSYKHNTSDISPILNKAGLNVLNSEYGGQNNNNKLTDFPSKHMMPNDKNLADKHDVINSILNSSSSSNFDSARGKRKGYLFEEPGTL